MPETRKIRTDLTQEERDRLERYGSLNFASIRRPDWRVEKFLPCQRQH
jgi:hypothetical protein